MERRNWRNKMEWVRGKKNEKKNIKCKMKIPGWNLISGIRKKIARMTWIRAPHCTKICKRRRHKISVQNYDSKSEFIDSRLLQSIVRHETAPRFESTWKMSLGGRASAAERVSSALQVKKLVVHESHLTSEYKSEYKSDPTLDRHSHLSKRLTSSSKSSFVNSFVLNSYSNSLEMNTIVSR